MKYLLDLKNADLSKKVCLLRLDFNTKDNWRMMAVLPTIKFLLKKCKAVLILSHKGRPNGSEHLFSLKSQAKELSHLLDKKITFLKDFNFLKIKRIVRFSPPNSLFLLENLRFLKGEEKNDSLLAKKLASLGDFYVNDAFAVSHRQNASMVSIAHFIKSYIGFELESEIKNLAKAIKNPKKPLIIILGGGKIEDKLQVYDNLKSKASKFLIGGALNKKLFNLKLKKTLMPVDFEKEKGKIMDIGPETAEIYCGEIKKAGTIIWNGPLGDINKKKFQNGTKFIAKCVASNTRAFKIIGGGETVMFLKKMGLDKKINFISTGGGAMLDFLAGRELPGIEALK